MFSKPSLFLHNIPTEYNVIITTCRVYRMLLDPFSMKWVTKHSLPRLRNTNLMLSLWDSSQGPLLMTLNPAVLSWQRSHSSPIMASHHPIHWLCSMYWFYMVDKHSYRNSNSSFKQIDTSWTSLVYSNHFIQTRLHFFWATSNGAEEWPRRLPVPLMHILLTVNSFPVPFGFTTCCI